MMVINLLAALMALLPVAENSDSSVTEAPSHYSVGASANVSTLLGRKDYGVDLVKKHSAQFYSVFVDWRANEADNSIDDRIYGYPTLEAGLLLGDFHNVRLRRENPETPYFSKLGYEWAAYASFRRDVLKTDRFAAGYAFGNGLGISTKPYDKETNVDNEFIGSRLSIYIGLDLYAIYNINKVWSAGMGFEFKHFSNSALDRPNKGANAIGLAARVVYHPDGNLERRTINSSQDDVPEFEGKGFYVDVGTSWGGKALLDDWLIYYYSTPETDSHYKTDDYKVYSIWGISAAPRYRDSRKYASGIGLDYYYSDYTERTKEVDILRGHPGYRYSKHILGLSLRHEAFYKQVSVMMGLGYYLHKKAGYIADVDEKPYYELAGLKYYPKWLGGNIYMGYNVKAHLLKADCFEVRLGMRLKGRK